MFGNVDEALDKAITKANTLHASSNGPFDLLILIATEDVLKSPAFELVRTGQVEVDLTTYLILNKSPSQTTGQEGEAETEQELPFQLGEVPLDVGQNMTVYASGNRPELDGGIVEHKDVEGLKVTHTNGLNSKSARSEPEKKPSEPGADVGTGSDIDRTSDILISNTWPAGILTHLTPAKRPQSYTQQAAAAVESSSIAKELGLRRPRYHFVSNKEAPVFWERLPYKSGDTGNRTTRFISLGKFGGPVRWFYAFNIEVPYNDETAQVPLETTANPFTVEPILKDPGTLTRESQNGVERFDTRKRPGEGRERYNKRRQQQQPIRPETCFLCLSNPAIAKHLIVSVATKSYVALAKGPLVKASPLPAHVLIVPIEHVATLKPDEREAVELERSKYALALSELFKDEVQGASTVMFEISRSRGIHLHTQVCAVPDVPSTRIADAFKEHAERAGLSLVERSLDSDETEYFRVQIMPPAGPAMTLVAELPEGTYFDAQFGRKVLAGLMELEDRLDWRACSQTESEEKEDSKVFRDAFKKYDFTL